MDPFKTVDGLVVPMDRSNVDTDAIIPKQFLKSTKRTGYGPYLFDSLRYKDVVEYGADCSKRPKIDNFVLNEERYTGAEILLARENFGCGSSREHAQWALKDYGIVCLIAPSFADIFYNNCFKNGMLPVTLAAEEIDILFSEVQGTIGYRLLVNLELQTITTSSDRIFSFEIDQFSKYCLLNGLDDIDLTLKKSPKIIEYENMRRLRAPWLFS